MRRLLIQSETWVLVVDTTGSFTWVTVVRLSTDFLPIKCSDEVTQHWNLFFMQVKKLCHYLNCHLFTKNGNLIYQYIWALSNKGLNCMGSLTCGYFSANILYFHFTDLELCRKVCIQLESIIFEITSTRVWILIHQIKLFLTFSLFLRQR